MKKPLLVLFMCCIIAFGATAQSIISAPYCMPTFAADNNPNGVADNFIYHVQYDTMDNYSSTTTMFDSSSYVFYNNLAPLPIHINAYAEMVVYTGPPLGAGDLCVYIDVNHDSVYEYFLTGHTEQIYIDYDAGGGTTHIPILLDSATARYGITRLRLQFATGLVVLPCQDYDVPADYYGETEEYLVNITGTYPLPTTTYATSITQNSAVLNGLINANDTSASADTFDYGLTTYYGNAIGVHNSLSLTDTPVNALITGLAPATTYHYRIRAKNANGTNYGRDTTFTTPLPTGITTVQNHQPVSIYPNPATNELHINNVLNDGSYSIQNAIGNTVANGSLLAGSNNISIQALPAGSYMIQVYSNNGERTVTKLIKE